MGLQQSLVGLEKALDDTAPVLTKARHQPLSLHMMERSRVASLQCIITGVLKLCEMKI